MSISAPMLRALTGLLLTLSFVAGAHAQVVVCVDPGHGGVDPGALGCSTYGLNEEDVNLDVGLKLEALLEADPAFTPMMTRTADVGVELYARAAFANDNGAQRFVSIHANAANGPASGIETFCATNGSTASFVQRDAIQAEMTALWPQLPDRGGKTANFTVLTATWMPASLSEMAFIDNCQPDAALLAQESERQAAAEAHWQALRESLGLGPGQSTVPGGETPGGDSSGGGAEPPQAVATGALTGVVFEDTGAGVADMSIRVGGASVTVSGPEGVATVASSPSTGMWLFNLTPGEWTVDVEADGYQAATRYCVVVQGQTTWCSVGLQPSAPWTEPPGSGDDSDSTPDGAGDGGAEDGGAEDGADEGSQDPPSEDGDEADSSGDSQGGSTGPVDAKGFLLGVVRDASTFAGIPAQLVISGLSETHTTETDEQGHWDLNVGAGTWVVTAMAPDYQTGSKTCQVLSGAAAICTLDLVPNSTSTRPDTGSTEPQPQPTPSSEDDAPETAQPDNNCGDGVCDNEEDTTSCPRDCRESRSGCCEYTGEGVCPDQSCVEAVSSIDPYCADQFDSHCVACAHGISGYEGLDCSAVGDLCGCGSSGAEGVGLDPFGSADGSLPIGGNVQLEGETERIESQGCQSGTAGFANLGWGALLVCMWLTRRAYRRRRLVTRTELFVALTALAGTVGCAPADNVGQAQVALVAGEAVSSHQVFADLRAPVISPDGSRLIATSIERDALFLIERRTGERTLLVQAPHCGYGPVWMDEATIAYRAPGQRLSDVPLSSVRVDGRPGPIPTPTKAGAWLTFDDDHGLWLKQGEFTRRLSREGERACCAQASPDFSLIAFLVLGEGLRVYDVQMDRMFDLGHAAEPAWVGMERTLVYRKVLGTAESLALSSTVQSAFGADVKPHEEVSRGVEWLQFDTRTPRPERLEGIPHQARHTAIPADRTWAAYEMPNGLHVVTLPQP